MSRSPKYLKRAVLDPLGLNVAVSSHAEITKDLAKAYMWTIDGRVFEAPTFELGMSPAGSMYTTVTDMGRFMSALFAGGRGTKGQMLKSSTIEQMWTPQFAPPGQKTGYGIGFSVREFEGRRTVGHGGAIYGFATTLKAMPDDKLGVVVVTTKDSANAVTNRIADFALTAMLAARQGKHVRSRKSLRLSILNSPVESPGVTSNGPISVELIECGQGSRNSVALVESKYGCGHSATLSSLMTSSLTARRYWFATRRSSSATKRLARRESLNRHLRLSQLARTDRRVRMGSRHPLYLREGWKALGPDRVVRVRPA